MNESLAVGCGTVALPQRLGINPRAVALVAGQGQKCYGPLQYSDVKGLFRCEIIYVLNGLMIRGYE
jgi:hypothetical protein